MYRETSLVSCRLTQGVAKIVSCLGDSAGSWSGGAGLLQIHHEAGVVVSDIGIAATADRRTNNEQTGPRSVTVG